MSERDEMSWQTYVDEHLMCEIEGHHLTAAAIVGQDGSVWAQSASFPQVYIHPDRIIEAFDDLMSWVGLRTRSVYACVQDLAWI